MQFLKLSTTILAIGLLISSCSSRREFVKNPVDDIIRDLNAEQNFSIILYDMNYDEKQNSYMHQYQILVEKTNPDTITTKTTDWLKVSDEFFNAHVNDMGMEITSKQEGVVKKAVAPAGYSNYVGNEKYGHWVQRDGGSFWEFYGKYAMLRSVFHMMGSPVRYGYWDDYHRNYRGYGRPYYGPTSGGRTMYGTNSTYANKNMTRSTWHNKPSTFKNRVRSQVSRSSSNSRISRSSNRYSSGSSGSSSRSRSGGFGK